MSSTSCRRDRGLQRPHDPGGHRDLANGGGLLNEGTATLNNCVDRRKLGSQRRRRRHLQRRRHDDRRLHDRRELGVERRRWRRLRQRRLDHDYDSTWIAANATPNGDGGGFYFNGVGATISQSTVSGNSASGGDGGGIYVNGNTFTLTNCTVTGNDSVDGGGIFIIGNTATLIAGTIASNTATNLGGGLENLSTPQLQGVIVANNTGGNCDGTVTDGGTNLQFPGTTCGVSITSADPLLGPLADNGGPTQTMALGVGSPAIDANTESCPPPAIDQRGIARPQGAACDIGAFELVPGGGPTPTPTVTPPPGATATPTPCPRRRPRRLRYPRRNGPWSRRSRGRCSLSSECFWSRRRSFVLRGQS